MTRDQWEYLVVRLNNVVGKLDDILNPHGADGWELVALQAQPPMTNLIFKRKADK